MVREEEMRFIDVVSDFVVGEREFISFLLRLCVSVLVWSVYNHDGWLFTVNAWRLSD